MACHRALLAKDSVDQSNCGEIWNLLPQLGSAIWLYCFRPHRFILTTTRILILDLSGWNLVVIICFEIRNFELLILKFFGFTVSTLLNLMFMIHESLDCPGILKFIMFNSQIWTLMLFTCCHTVFVRTYPWQVMDYVGRVNVKTCCHWQRWQLTHALPSCFNFINCLLRIPFDGFLLFFVGVQDFLIHRLVDLKRS